MDLTKPFVLLDDARGSGAAPAHLYCDPRETFVARQADDVTRVLDKAIAAQAKTGGHLAGTIAYEAGLALEPKLAGLANARSGADGPLIWLGLFDTCLLYTSPSPRDRTRSRMPSSA